MKNYFTKDYIQGGRYQNNFHYIYKYSINKEFLASIGCYSGGKFTVSVKDIQQFNAPVYSCNYWKVEDKVYNSFDAANEFLIKELNKQGYTLLEDHLAILL
jgi:hypothetical protein